MLIIHRINRKQTGGENSLRGVVDSLSETTAGNMCSSIEETGKYMKDHL